jgi:phosphomannomutase
LGHNKWVSEIAEIVERWIEIDPDPQTSDELSRLLERGDVEQLDSLFRGRIAFGTAGLRAALGPGPNRMNRLVVRQTTAGLMRWLNEKGAAAPLVVIGYDARHGSLDFARDTAGVVAAMGGSAMVLPRPLPTPVLARAVLTQGADAGVMVTASHNPPADNGYKLYLADGIQLVAPADAEIAAAIDEIAAAGESIEVSDTGIVVLDEAAVQDHLDAIQAALFTDHRAVSVVYTAMHGVGGEHLMAAFEQAGFPAPSPVPEQFEPDPDFPTASFPNPEEPGALDLALALASDRSADLIVANDPDADRLALAVPARSGTGFVPLTGDQIGVLLADHVMGHTSGDDRIVASSLVSSRLISKMAEARGIASETTLTGFKWVARPMVEQPELNYLLGYEEAIGYSIGGIVRDKDGISAALVAAEMVAESIASNETVWDRLDRLALQHGWHLTAQVSIRFEGTESKAKMAATMVAVTSDPPSTMCGQALRSVENLADGIHLPPTTGIVLYYVDETRIIVRPSGTEPKIKAYVEVIEPVTDPGDVDEARIRAEEHLSNARTAVTSMLAGG